MLLHFNPKFNVKNIMTFCKHYWFQKSRSRIEDFGRGSSSDSYAIENCFKLNCSVNFILQEGARGILYII